MFVQRLFDCRRAVVVSGSRCGDTKLCRYEGQRDQLSQQSFNLEQVHCPHVSCLSKCHPLLVAAARPAH